MHYLPPSYFTHAGVFLSILLSQFVLRSPSSLCLQVCPLHPYSCPANRLVHQVLLYFTWGFVQSFLLCLEYLLWFFSIPARLAYLLLSNTLVISPQSLGTGYLSAWTVPPLDSQNPWSLLEVSIKTSLPHTVALAFPSTWLSINSFILLYFSS